MRRKNPDDVYEPTGSAYSQVVASPVEEMVFVAGTVPKDESGSLVGAGDMGTQIRQVVENIEASLSGEGATLSDVVRVRTFTTDMERYLSAESIVLEYFGEEKPASTLVSVEGLADDFDGVKEGTKDTEDAEYMVEVDATAVLR